MSKLIIVDDRHSDRLLISRAALRRIPDLQIVEFQDGREFVEYMTSSNTDAPDVVMLDINMNRISGHSALEQLIDNAKLKTALVVVMSDSNLARDIDNSYARGADTYIRKPTSISLWEQVIQTAFSKKKGDSWIGG